MTKHSPSFNTLEGLVLDAAEAARPPERLTVSEFAERHRKLNNPGSYVGPWKNSMTPYLVEPMDILTDRTKTKMAFVGSAQTGKTDMFLNYLGHATKCDPADMLLVQTTQKTAKDFSILRVDKLHRHSPDVGAMLAPSKSDDNVFDKRYKNGMICFLSWPSINELSGKPIPRLWLTDYDRMDQDVDGEGSPFSLASTRATSFRRHGMCVAESTPGFVVDNPRWVRTSKHEAPPTQGILSIYNQGDRRQWYWRCVSCDTPFAPDFELLSWPDTEDFMEAAEAAVLKCPHCELEYNHDAGEAGPGKHEMNLEHARWVPDNTIWGADGELHGTPIQTDTASFWLKGVCAAFSDWKKLVFNYLNAEQTYQNTGSENDLKTTVNVDQGKAYTPKSLASDRVPEALKARARDYGVHLVPAPVRFLIATVDVQKNRFVVQVQGIAANGDIYVIDRFDIKKSKRPDEEAGGFLWVNPGAYPEDWKLLSEEVINRSYELSDGTGRRMGIKQTICDSGGKGGTTANAYAFYRWLRWGDPVGDEGNIIITEEGELGEYEWSPGMAGKFLLLKGSSMKSAPRVQISYPDSQRKDRTAGARGEIPVLFINPNTLKDTLDHKLDRTDPGGRICFANWLDDNFYIELTVEVKDAQKGWLNPKRFRNESWDLLVYCIAGMLTQAIGFEHIDFQDPPGWAEVWDMNDLVFDPELVDKPFSTENDKRRSLADLAKDLG